MMDILSNARDIFNKNVLELASVPTFMRLAVVIRTDTACFCFSITGSGEG
jgi:hypothetical protein